MEEWSFSESKLASLPLDKETENFTRQVNINKLMFLVSISKIKVPGAVFSCVSPTPWKTAPLLVAHSQEALELLDLDQEVTETKEFLDWVAGNKVLEGSVPMAHR